MSSGQDSPPLQPPSEGQDTAQEILGGFPRHLTRQLIEEQGVWSSWRTLLAGWLLGAGFTLLALALPQEALVGRGPGLVSAWSRGGPPDGAYAQFWLLRGLSALARLRLEPTAFLASALFYGGCAPLLLGLGRRVGLSAASAVAVVLVVQLSPIAWLVGTTPGPEALGLFCATALLYLLWCGRERGLGFGRRLVVLAIFAVGAGASPLLAWTLPAVALALSASALEPTRARPQRAIAWGAAGAGMVALAYLALGTPLLFDDLTTHLDGETRLGRPGAAGFTDGPGLLGALARTSLIAPALGLALLGLLALMFQRRNESEEGPPRWLALWGWVPLAVFIALGPAQELPLAYLLPLAALGGFDLVARREDELDARVLPALVVVELLVLFGAQGWLRGDDPLAAWRMEARTLLEPNDLVVAAEPEHVYLLRERWNVEVLELSDSESLESTRVRFEQALELARQREQRVVVDERGFPLPALAANLPRIADL